MAVRIKNHIFKNLNLFKVREKETERILRIKGASEITEAGVLWEDLPRNMSGAGEICKFPALLVLCGWDLGAYTFTSSPSDSSVQCLRTQVLTNSFNVQMSKMQHVFEVT